MDSRKNQELEEKLEKFEKYIESSIEVNKESDQESIKNGEYKYLIESHNIQDDCELSESLQEALDNSSLSKDDLLEKVVKDENFEMEYEELASPFQYGGAMENEFYCLPWGGDRECQIDREQVQEFLPSFDLKQEFSSLSEFQEFVDYNIGRQDYLKQFWNFATTSLTHTQIIYNTDYDVVRCLIEDEEGLIEFLKQNPKPEEPFERKKLKLVMSDYHNLRNGHDGFCIKCGKINEGNHEPDAEKYECTHCETRNSYGIEILFMSGDVEIVDTEDESNIEESY